MEGCLRRRLEGTLSGGVEKSNRFRVGGKTTPKEIPWGTGGSDLRVNPPILINTHYDSRGLRRGTKGRTS